MTDIGCAGILMADTFCGPMKQLPVDPCHYQPKDEHEEWFAKDPLERFALVLIERSVADEAGLEAIKTKILHQFDETVERAKNAPLPTVEDLTTDVFV